MTKGQWLSATRLHATHLLIHTTIPLDHDKNNYHYHYKVIDDDSPHFYVQECHLQRVQATPLFSINSVAHCNYDWRDGRAVIDMVQMMTKTSHCNGFGNRASVEELWSFLPPLLPPVRNSTMSLNKVRWIIQIAHRMIQDAIPLHLALTGSRDGAWE